MSIDACAEMVRQADPDRFASAMCAPMPERGALMVIYAFNIEVARAPWVTQEEMIAEMRLQWWKDAITEIYDGKTVRKHEVVTPLSEIVGQGDRRLPRALFDDLIEARRFDIYRDPHSGIDDFTRYISNTSSNIMELAARLLGAQDVRPFQEFGWATGFANLVSALPELYAHGRDPIPMGQTDKNALIEGRVNDEFCGVISALTSVALNKTNSMSADRVNKEYLPALLSGWNTRRVLNSINDAPENVLRTDFASSPFRRTLSLALYSSGIIRFKG